MDITITIPYTDVLGRCTMLAAFEAKQAVAADGNKNFSETRITAKDAPALLAYIREGAGLLEARLASTFDISGSYGDEASGNITWTLHDETTRRAPTSSSSGFAKSATEAVVCFALSRWFDGKLPESTKAYGNMFADMSEAALRIINTKRKPSRPS